MKAVLLKPRSSFSTQLRSDTIWGLIMLGIRNVYSEEKLNEVISRYEANDIPFIISSAFPFLGTGTDRVYFFPKPVHSFYAQDLDITKFKEQKKIEYISLNEFENYINDNAISEYKDIAPKLRSAIVQKNTIDSLTNSTSAELGGNLFNLNEFYLDYPNTYTQKQLSRDYNQYANSDLGYYFLVDGDMELITPALNYLQHYGFGGNHSRGKSFFEVEISENDFMINQPNDNNCYINLSYYLPTVDEVNEFKKSPEMLYYDLEVRSGFISKEFDAGKPNKNSVVGFKEGAILPSINKKYYGNNLIVAESNNIKIRHYGYAFNIKAKIPSKL